MRRPGMWSGKDLTDSTSPLPRNRYLARIFVNPSTAPPNPAMM